MIKYAKIFLVETGYCILYGIILLFIFKGCTAKAGTVNVPLTVPDEYRYYTRDLDGTIFVWVNRPKRYYYDFSADKKQGFWYADGQYAIIRGGAVPKNWRATLRRIKK